MIALKLSARDIATFTSAIFFSFTVLAFCQYSILNDLSAGAKDPKTAQMFAAINAGMNNALATIVE